MQATIRLFVLLGMVVLAAACTVPPATPAPVSSVPVVVISSPASNSSFQAGDTVSIQSTSSDASGIVMVQLLVDGRPVEVSPTLNGQLQAQFSIIQTWTAVEGSHTVTVRGVNSLGTTGQASIMLNVAPRAAQVTPTVAPPTRVPPTRVPPTQARPAACSQSARFIADVTIPDGTTVAPGSQFVKTWAVQNSGTCAWNGTFSLVFVSGNQLGAGAPQPIPAAATGQTVNVSLNMLAPTTPGIYQSIWRLRAPNGVLFGDLLDVVIVVPGAPTATPTPAGCVGIPTIPSFEAQPSNSEPGQPVKLSWGLVVNASRVVLVTPEGNTGVATPGEVTVNPKQTTTYTLIAYCNTNTAQAQVTVNVSKPAPTSTPVPPEANQIRSIQVEKQGDKYQVTVEYYWNGTGSPAKIQGVGLNQDGSPVTNTDSVEIIAGFVKYVILNLQGQGVSTIKVCMVDSSGGELVCSQAAAS